MFFLLKKLLGEALYYDITKTVPIETLTEVRIRVNKPIIAKNLNRFFVISSDVKPEKAIDQCVEVATRHSYYAYEEEVANGYLYYDGGIRIGIAGKGVYENGNLKTFKDITSLNIRVPHEVKGCSDKVFKTINNFSNTLIISSPGAGKTTLIRDMVRVLSRKYDILLIDERNEIAGENPQGTTFDIGDMTDVISNVKKESVYEGAIRAMSPQIIVFDEIFPERDLTTIKEIIRCGVSVLASIHAKDEASLKKAYPDIINYFDYLIVLESNPKIGSIKSIIEVKDAKYNCR